VNTNFTWTWYGFGIAQTLIRLQNYKCIFYHIQHWRRLLLLALSCCFKAQNLRNATIKNNIFFPRKEKKKETKVEKKDMQVKQQCSGGCQGFLEKHSFYFSVALRNKKEDFFKNPQGLTFTAGKRNC
jgi:hypothetical protein